MGGVGSEMSGGARNIFVYNCTFMGTDKGLRFKSVRGRGGVVEHIYAKDIFMKDIAQEAIFFDMYYFVKFATDGQRDENPTTNEGTPVFRNMKFENIVCNGAQKGIFVRGLPEMPIEHIVMENVTLQTEKGVELIDAKKLQLKNIQLFAKDNNPLILIDNSSQVSFEQIGFNLGTALLFSVSGERSKDLQVSKTNLSAVQNKAVFVKGASEKQLVFMPNK